MCHISNNYIASFIKWSRILDVARFTYVGVRDNDDNEIWIDMTQNRDMYFQ